MSLLELPTEILLDVGLYFYNDISAVHALCLTSKRLYTTFIGLLYDNEPLQRIYYYTQGDQALHFALLNCRNDTLAHCIASQHFNLMAMHLSGLCQSRSALMLLPARLGNKTAINMLVARGVSIEHPEDFPPYRKRKQKKRPLELAFGTPHETKTVDPTAALTLVECRACMDGLWSQGSAIHFAALHGFAGVVRACLAKGASAEERNCHGDTPLHCALRLMFREREMIATIEALLEFGADVDALDRKGFSVTELAANRTADRERLPDAYRVAKGYRYRAVTNEHDVDWSGQCSTITISAEMKLALEEQDRQVVELLALAKAKVRG